MAEQEQVFKIAYNNKRHILVCRANVEDILEGGKYINHIEQSAHNAAVTCHRIAIPFYYRPDLFRVSGGKFIPSADRFKFQVFIYPPSYRCLRTKERVHFMAITYIHILQNIWQLDTNDNTNQGSEVRVKGSPRGSVTVKFFKKKYFFQNCSEWPKTLTFDPRGDPVSSRGQRSGSKGHPGGQSRSNFSKKNILFKIAQNGQKNLPLTPGVTM